MSSDPLHGSVPLGAHPPGTLLDHQCTGGPSAPAWCGRAASLVALPVSNATPWFCCDIHTEEAPTLPIAALSHGPDYDYASARRVFDNHRARQCLVCSNHQLCDKYGDWTCGNCKQEYLYNETEPNIVLTDVQRELLRAAWEKGRTP